MSGTWNPQQLAILRQVDFFDKRPSVELEKVPYKFVYRFSCEQLALPPASFDGVFANASLFHVPQQELPRVLADLRDALVPEGVLFSSNHAAG